MKENYYPLFKRLIEAYAEGDFKETVDQMLKEEFEDDQQGREVLAALCGIDINTLNPDAFTYEIADAITKNQVYTKIVQKVHHCGEDCECIEGQSKCQSVCPFSAIMKDPDSGDKWIDPELCMNCGRCVTVCDKGNYMDLKQFLPLYELLKTGEKVIAIVAPAIAGQFGEQVSLDQLREAFIKIGFTDMMEVAVAADVLSLKEALEFSEHVKTKDDLLITSCCCPIWVAMLRKVYQDLVKYVSPSVSPMVAMGRIIKKLNPDAKVVFIGPCIAKKSEAKEPDIADAVDYVLTFQEVEVIFDAFKIDVHTLEGVPTIDYASRGGRLYAHTGGVSQAVYEIVEEIFPKKKELFKAIQIDGAANCKQFLNKFEQSNNDITFVEGMGCIGGCVGGPKAIVNKEIGKEAVDKVAYESAIKIPVHSEVLVRLFEQLDIHSVEDLKAKSSLFERSFES